jgi:DNA processing protein
MQERFYWLGFSYFSGIGPKKFKLLLDEFKSAKDSWEADPESLQKILGKALTPSFIKFRDNFSITDYAEKLEKNRVKFLTQIDKGYPKLLSELSSPPYVLYVKGKFEFNVKQNQKTIAIVGTRKITEYGKQVTSIITSDMVNNGFVIVSGLALGVDAVSHKTTLQNKGKTVAVLGCGVDCCYPRENQALYDSIIESGGAIVSEYPLSQSPSLGSFPSRNKIISGLSQGVVVTEGAFDSGAIYTADHAFSNNRPVFAVPGPITSSLSKGPHSLIGKGAKLISGAEEILTELRIKSSELRNENIKNIKGSTKDEQKIIDLLQNESMHFDELVKRIKLDSSKLGSILSLMEMKGMIKSLGGGVFRLGGR